jgi:precorrin-2 methylase
MSEARLCAVGVGPGDLELIILKAVKIIKSSDCTEYKALIG